MTTDAGSTAASVGNTATTTTTNTNNTPPATDVLEERMIDEEYKIWKKNTPFLYDYVMTHSLEWPSLTVQWLPTPAKTVSEFSQEHLMLIGTHTTGEPNYLMIASCCLPKEPTSDYNNEYQHLQQEGQGNAASSSSNKKSGSKRSNSKAPVFTAPEYDEEKGEFGGYGLAPAGPQNSAVGKITIQVKIPHEGEVNRARVMPQNHFIVASRGPAPEVYIWDRSKHPSRPEPNATPSPQGVCIGHTREGYGMVWSTLNSGHLATASEDHTVKLWDVSQMNSGSNKPGTQIQAVQTLSAHTDTVEDVDWHCKDPNLIVSVGGDRQICLWNRLSGDKPHFVVKDAHLSDINSVAFNPHNEYILATGSSDKTIGIWDVRRLSQKVHSLENVHVDDVFSLAWAPHDEAILASCSADRRVAVYDLSKVGQEQSPEEAPDGPPELLFLHGGHTSKVSDMAWNWNAPWTLASTSEDNIIQIWHMAEEIYAGTGEMGKGSDEEDGLGRDELE